MFPSGEGSAPTPPPPSSSSSSLKYPSSSSLYSGSYLSSYGSYYHHMQDPYTSTGTHQGGGSAPLYHPHPTTENPQWYSSSTPHFGHPFYSPDWACHHPGANAPFLPDSESQAYGSLMSHAASSQSAAPGQSSYFRKGVLDEEGEADEEPEEGDEKSLLESHVGGGNMIHQHHQQTTGGSSPLSKGKGSPFEWISNSSKRGLKSSSLSSSSVPHGKEGLGRTRTKDKYRVVYSDHQRLELEKEFHYSRYITIRRKAELATGLGLTERQVKIWFQNRRAKERKQLKKRDEIVSKETRGGGGPNGNSLPEGGLHHSMAAAAVAAFNPAAVMLSHRHHAHLSSSIGSPPNS